MDLIKSRKYRSRLSSLVYILLNVSLAASIFATIYVTNSPVIALILVSLSKWRTFSVRPRFWYANVLANLVDLIVGVSLTLLIYVSTGNVWLQLGLMASYIVWLLIIKPRSKYIYSVVQAGAALFLGLLALFLVSYSWDVFFIVLVAWLIAYAAARHVINNYEDAQGNLYALTAAFICAELVWVSYYWMVAYEIPGLGAIKVPQAAVFATLLGFVAERAARSHHKHGKVRGSDILMPIILTAMVMLVAYIAARLSGSDAL